MVEIVNRLNKTKKFLYTRGIEGEIAKDMISEITDIIPLAREYKASRVGDSSEDPKGKTDFSKRIREETVGYGSYLKKHKKGLAKGIVAIALGIPTASTTYILASDGNLEKLLRDGKIWDDVSLYLPDRGNFPQPGHLDHTQVGSRNPNAADIANLAITAFTFALMTAEGIREGVRYYKSKKSNQQ